MERLGEFRSRPRWRCNSVSLFGKKCSRLVRTQLVQSRRFTRSRLASGSRNSRPMEGTARHGGLPGGPSTPVALQADAGVGAGDW